MHVNWQRRIVLDGNAVLPGTIRQICEELKITWGHVSSGCIFSGRKSDGGGWTEDDVLIFPFVLRLVVFTVDRKH